MRGSEQFDSISGPAWILCCFIVGFALAADATPDAARAAPAVSGVAPGEPETHLDHFLSDQATALGDPNHELLSDQVDKLAQALDRASAQDPQLVDGLGQALHLDEISQVQVAQRFRRSLSLLVDDGGGGLVMFPRNPHIVHASRKVDVEQLRELAGGDFTKLSYFDQQEWYQAARELEEAHDGLEVMEVAAGHLHSPRPVLKQQHVGGLLQKSVRLLSRIVSIIANYGLPFLDHFYAAPDFIDHIPGVGKQLTELRKRGEPIYISVKLLRLTYCWYKLKFGTTKRAPKRRMRRRLAPGEQVTQTGVGRTGAGAGTGTGTVSLEDMQLVVTSERGSKLSELEKMIGELGIEAIKSVVVRVYKPEDGDELDTARIETNIRTFFLILTYVLDRRK